MIRDDQCIISHIISKVKIGTWLELQIIFSTNIRPRYSYILLYYFIPAQYLYLIQNVQTHMNLFDLIHIQIMKCNTLRQLCFVYGRIDKK